MIVNNGVGETIHLSETQLRPLQQLLGPLVSRLTTLEIQSNEIRQSINDIAAMYLTSLGLPSEANIDLKTGALTPVKEQESVNG